jgi:hypothetical protein
MRETPVEHQSKSLFFLISGGEVTSFNQLQNFGRKARKSTTVALLDDSA